MLSPEHRPQKHHDYAPRVDRHMEKGRPAMKHYCEHKGEPENGLKSGMMHWKEKGEKGMKKAY